MRKTWTTRIDPAAKLVDIPVTLRDADGRVRDATFILDCGTQITIIDRKLAASIGLTVDRSEGPSRLVGPTGPDIGYKARIPGFEVMGGGVSDMLVRCHSLYSNAGVDGLVGLDIIRQGE